MRQMQAWGWVGLALLLSAAALQADTLYTRDGRRMEGVVVSMRDGTIEFEVRRGNFGRDRIRVDRADVDRIEFDRFNDSAGGFDNNNGGAGGFGNNGPTNTRPSGLRERDVVVRANVRWQDTGVTVRPGQSIYFNAAGRVRWGPGRQDGPQGERGSPRNEARPIPSRPAAALIGRIGDDNDFFFIGDDEAPIRVRGGGRLYLGINDDMLGDNSGSFQVTIYY